MCFDHYYLIRVICLLQTVSLLYGVPPETCIVSQQCNSYCQSFGYSRGMCRTKLQYGAISPVKRYCLCTECNHKYCKDYCQKIGRKFTGCTCFSFSQRSSVLQLSETNFANDCNNDVLYCQCAR